MQNLFQRITQGDEDQILFKAGVTGENGRLTPAGSMLFIDLLFKGTSLIDARKEIIEACKKELKFNKS